MGLFDSNIEWPQTAAEFLCFLLKDIYVHSYFLLFLGITMSVLTSPNCLTLSAHPTSVEIWVSI